MSFLPFPRRAAMRWRRLDVPGREEALVEQTAGGWRLTGEVEAEEAGVVARLAYVIECDGDWRTRRAVVTGLASGAPVTFDFAADGAGRWTLNGAALPLVEGALDIDLFRYDALVDGERFRARLDTDDFGRVVLYEGLWEAEA